MNIHLVKNSHLNLDKIQYKRIFDCEVYYNKRLIQAIYRNCPNLSERSLFEVLIRSLPINF
uniref:Uncharacterized protein n=1 Tax=Rhizophagus irregularis (strain DAOM 181602 / DAOM 197198 / MUCL 43194) TaxID=747089 RepID=U9UNX5_RHIID